MVERKININSRTGLQSKSAAIFIQKASNYKSDIWIVKGERKANAKSLLGVLSLGIGPGEQLSISAEGVDEEQAVAEISEYLCSLLGDTV